jgi:hypothetical protein
MSVDEIDEKELPVLYGLWQLIPTDEPYKTPIESAFMKVLIQVFYWITLPVLFLFYWKNERPATTENFLRKVYIATLIFTIPAILGLLYKYKKIYLSRYAIMISIWVSMFSVIVLIYAS